MNVDFDSKDSSNRNGPVSHRHPSPRCCYGHSIYLDSIQKRAGGFITGTEGHFPLRVIAGQYRSRPLRSRRGLDIRPTSDRLREALFNVLTAGNPSALAGSVWVDLYAGTGAVGIEALSRGAGKVYFVEMSAAAVEVIHENLNSLQIKSGFEVIQADALKGLRRLVAGGPLGEYVFLDPPYQSAPAYHDTLDLLAKGALLKEASTVIAEHQKRFDPGEDFGSLKRYRKLVQGDAALSFYRRA